MLSVKSLTFAWWNTGLAPSAASRSTLKDRATACRVVVELITQIGADFIALGEMSEFDLDEMATLLSAFDFDVKSGITKAGRAKFDLCYAYNKHKISVLDSKDIVDERGNSTLRIAQKLAIATLGDDTIFHLLVSHWPSRLYCHGDDPDRHIYGMRLRDQVKDLMDEGGDDAFVLTLGDYNDEPFDKSLSHQLMASRDIDLVRRKKHLLYNPFWQHFCKRPQKSLASGSYFYNGGDITKWYTFDQIILSQAFISSNKWNYSHKEELVYDNPELIELIMQPKTNFDHLPVYCRVEKVI